MPLFNRADWLEGLKQIKSVNVALQRQQKALTRTTKKRGIKGELDDEAKDFYSKANEVVDRGIKEELEGLVGEVITKLHTQELPIVFNDLRSARVVESICQYASEAQLKDLLEMTSSWFRLLICHSSAAFVLQAILKAIQPFINSPNSVLPDIFLKCLEQLRGRWRYEIRNLQASYCMQAIVCLLGNMPIPKTPEEAIKKTAGSPHASFHEEIISISEEFFKNDRALRDYRLTVLSTSPCRVIKVLVVAVQDLEPNLYEKFVKWTITNIRGKFYDKKFMFKSEAWCRLQRIIIDNLSDENLFSLFREYFIHRDFIMSIKKGVFARDIVVAMLQAIGRNQFSTKLVTRVIDTMFTCFKRLLATLRLRFLDEILNIATKYTHLQQMLFDHFYTQMCGDDGLKFFSDLVFYAKHSPRNFSKVGTKVLKTLASFRFENKKLLLRSMYKSPPDFVARVVCAKNGLLDGLFTPDVPPLIAHKFIKHISDLIPKMVTTLHGTIFVIHLFERANVKYKREVVEQLVHVLNVLALLPFHFPQFLIERTQVELFQQDPEKWEKKMKKSKEYLTAEEQNEVIKKHIQVVREQKGQQKEKEESKQKQNNGENEGKNNKRKAMQEQEAPKKKRQRLQGLTVALPRFKKLTPDLYGKYGKKTGRTAKEKEKREKTKFQMRMKQLIRIEKRRIDKMRYTNRQKSLKRSKREIYEEK